VQLADLSVLSGDLKLAAWGRNLDDKEYTMATSFLGAVSSIYGTPRTYGVDVIYEFQ
jgi:iron complex outermembrane receptor protein